MHRRFVSRHSALLVGVLLAGLLTAAVITQAPAADRMRSYVSGSFLFSLDSVKCGLLKSVDGGGISADVIEEAAGPSQFVKKHIGQPRYEPFTLQVGFSMTKSLYEWVRDSWKTTVRKNGSVSALDYNLNATSQLDFTDALITETTFPACDGSSKEPAYLKITFAPEYTREAPPPAGKVSGELGKNEQKMWLPSNFRLEIGGLDCTKVSKIDSFTVKRETINIEIGEARDVLKEASEVVFPNLRITMSVTAAQGWYDWHKDFVVTGNNDESKEKNGTLTFLSANRQTELGKVTFYNLGIYRIGPEKSEASADQIKRVVADLYCERMEFEYLSK